MIKPSRIFAIAAVLGLLGGLSLGCGSAAPANIALTAADAGRNVDLRPGDRLTVALDGNVTTGYTWDVVTVNADILRTTGEPAYQSDSKLLGSGGTISLRFEAVGRGQTPLQLAYRRPFERGEPPARSYQITVTVR